MRFAHLTWMSVILALALCGCATRGNIEVLEAALRQQEDQLISLRQELEAARSELEVSQSEVSRLRTELADSGQPMLSSEHLENEFKAVGLRFNSYLTSGVDRDDVAGDEFLSVLLYPHDDQGGLVKLAGTVELKAVDLSAPKGQHEIGHWTFTPAQTKDAWHSGFLAAGFLFEEEWQQMPQGSDVTLYARFTTIDGRKFEAVQPLRVKTAAAQPLAQQNRAQPVTVEAGKPTLRPALHQSPPGASANSVEHADELDFESEESELRELLSEPGQSDQANVLETSDRYREWDLPVIR